MAGILVWRRSFHSSCRALARKKKLTRTAEKREFEAKVKKTASQTMVKLNPQKFVQRPTLRYEDVPGAFPKEPFSDFVIRQLTYRHPSSHFESVDTKSPAFDFETTKTVFKASMMAGLSCKKDLNLDPKKLLGRAKELQRANAHSRAEYLVNVSNLSNPLMKVPKKLAYSKPKKAKQFERSIDIESKIKQMPKLIDNFRQEMINRKEASKSELPF